MERSAEEVVARLKLPRGAVALMHVCEGGDLGLFGREEGGVGAGYVERGEDVLGEVVVEGLARDALENYPGPVEADLWFD